MDQFTSESMASLDKAKQSALQAVDTYNKTGTVFRSGTYIVLMVIAWTSLFHAIFWKNKVKPYYEIEDDNGNSQYQKVDEDYKRWELSECLRQYYQSQNTPERKNLEFFIGLRNKIEHRNMPELDVQIFGECQAMLLNFESLLVNEFGEECSLNENLAMSLQFSTITDEGKREAIRRLSMNTYPSVTDYVENFRSGLTSDIYESMEFSYRVFLLPKIGNHMKSSDLAVEFINVNQLDDSKIEEYERVVALLKTREVQVRNPGYLKPGQVVSKVSERLEYNLICIIIRFAGGILMYVLRTIQAIQPNVIQNTANMMFLMGITFILMLG